MSRNILGEKLGRFLSNFTYVLLTLFVHIGLTILTYILLSYALPAEKSAGFIAYEIATGGDPYNFVGDIQSHYWTWRWILLFHVISWLIVPVIAATAVDAAFRIYEQRKAELSATLSDRMEDIMIRHLGLSPEDAEKLALKTRQEMEKEIRDIKQK
jgi:hypothetical protein